SRLCPRCALSTQAEDDLGTPMNETVAQTTFSGVLILYITNPLTRLLVAGTAPYWRLTGLSLHRLSAALKKALISCKRRHTHQFEKTVYRIVYADRWATKEHLVSGVNASERGGRWNPGGQGVHTCYTCEHEN